MLCNAEEGPVAKTVTVLLILLVVMEARSAASGVLDQLRDANEPE